MEDHRPVYHEWGATYYVSKREDVLVSICVHPEDDTTTTVNFTEIKTGKLLTKIDCSELGKPCCLAFCEDRYELFVANTNGKVTVYKIKHEN